MQQCRAQVHLYLVRRRYIPVAAKPERRVLLQVSKQIMETGDVFLVELKGIIGGFDIYIVGQPVPHKFQVELQVLALDNRERWVLNDKFKRRGGYKIFVMPDEPFGAFG